MLPGNHTEIKYLKIHNIIQTLGQQIYANRSREKCLMLLHFPARITEGDFLTSQGSHETFITRATHSVDWRQLRSLSPLVYAPPPSQVLFISNWMPELVMYLQTNLIHWISGHPSNLVEPTHPVYNIGVESASNAARFFDRLQVPLL